jgi:hypothetical protein
MHATTEAHIFQTLFQHEVFLFMPTLIRTQARVARVMLAMACNTIIFFLIFVPNRKNKN